MADFVHEVVPLAVTCENGDFVVHYFITKGRGTFLPFGAVWTGSNMWEREPTDENIRDNLYNSFLDRPVVSWRRLSLGDIPQDRTYRNAWQDDGFEIVHDMQKAKEVHRQNVRHSRVSAFAALDGEYIKASSQGESTSDVEKKQRAWRDAPADPRIDAAKTVEDLTKIPLPG